MIERFSKQEFEAALPVFLSTGSALWTELGLINGEYCYKIIIDDKVYIMVRSSINKNGISADNGTDSIRCWLVDSSTGKPIANKIQRWICRTKNWRKNLTETLRNLWRLRKSAGDCSECGCPKSIFKSKQARSKNAIFAKCMICDSGFAWIGDKIK